MTQKLDYLEDLGVTALWLLPFCPSPLKDDGYDIADYGAINPDYGSLKDFKTFLKEAHRRGFKVISELVLNHTSDQHDWFKKARRAKKDSKERNFYVWSDDPNRYKEARLIFPDFEPSNWAWDPVAQQYYWHRFFSHQPDLNYENPVVRKTMFEVVDFWLKLGVDGLRLDAIPYLYEEEGTDCVGLPQTHQYLKDLRKHVDSKFKDRTFLAEANMWPEDAISFFGDGDECHMSFHFPLMPRLFMAVKMESRFPIVDILEQTPEIPSNCQWANFLRNHDELTLEMVTDEERDYMYRSYVHEPEAKINAGIRRRLAPLLRNNRRQIELLNGLLFSLVGTPIIYYGDEIGMGDNIYLGDRNGVRTPMQWSADRNAGFSKANPQKLVYPVTLDPEFYYETINVEAQENNTHSLLWWMRRLISLRKRYKAFSRGSLEFLYPDNQKILAFTRCWKDQKILVVANLSRFAQGTKLDLSAYEGMQPVELFGQNPFPTIESDPYFMTLSPHSFYWFSLEESREEHIVLQKQKPKRKLPVLTLKERWEDLLSHENREALIEAFPEYLIEQHWFGGKGYKIRQVKILGEIPLFEKGIPGVLMLLQADYVGKESQAYLVGLVMGSKEKLKEVRRRIPQHVLAEVKFPKEQWEGGLYNAVSDHDFCKILLDYIAKKRTLKGPGGDIIASSTKPFKKIMEESKGRLDPKVLELEKNNTSVVFGKSFILKIFRRLEWGTNPDLEISRFLNEHSFPYTPPLVGMAEYYYPRGEPVTLALLYGYVPNQGDAWAYTLDFLQQFFERALATGIPREQVPMVKDSLADYLSLRKSPLASELIGPYLASVQRMGEITASLHKTLASDPDDKNFAPVPFDPHYQRSLYQSVRSLAARTFTDLKNHLSNLSQDTLVAAQRVIKMEKEILSRLNALLGENISATRIRCHGDYNLEQLLYTGKDFVVIDFEGEPNRPWSERKLKRSPFRDVGSMLRSFHYAAFASLFSEKAKDLSAHDGLPLMIRWAHFWYQWVSGTFIRSYLRNIESDRLLPKDPKQLEILLAAELLEKCLYEIDYEINFRPDWVHIPLQGILQLMKGASGQTAD